MIHRLVFHICVWSEQMNRCAAEIGNDNETNLTFVYISEFVVKHIEHGLVTLD
jgi:hypothetical protein